VISDLRMPQMDGVALLREIIARWPDTAVIMVTAVAEVESAVACLQLGALDYVAKPFHLDEVRARVMQALDKRRLKLELEGHRQHLEERVREQAHRIEELSLERLQALVYFLEEKDTYLRGHSVRVTKYAVGIAGRLGLSQDIVDVISLGAELHDIGKIGVSEAVLHKPGKLTEAEYKHIMEHPAIGARILAPLMRDTPIALAIVRHHHERLGKDGSSTQPSWTLSWRNSPTRPRCRSRHPNSRRCISPLSRRKSGALTRPDDRHVDDRRVRRTGHRRQGSDSRNHHTLGARLRPLGEGAEAARRGGS
jgi:putative nucleotidyltransferase with HDIG domain